MEDVRFFLDAAQSGQHLNILTRDGRALVGGTLEGSDVRVAMQETLMAQNFGARMQLLEARDRRLAAEREMAELHHALELSQQELDDMQRAVEREMVEPLRAENKRLLTEVIYKELKMEEFRKEMLRGDEFINHMRELYPDLDTRIPAEEEDTRT
jgi:hypothetical protein